MKSTADALKAAQAAAKKSVDEKTAADKAVADAAALAKTAAEKAKTEQATADKLAADKSDEPAAVEATTKAAEAAKADASALVCFSASGGARMQESLLSLMQMAKTSAALASLAESGIPFISVLTDPTTGGVSASLAMLGDLNVGEPRALIGFAGPRVIEQTVRETLPEGFQRSEFLLEHGALDLIVDRRNMRDELARVLAKLCKAPLPEIDSPES